jgi:4-coumarate--CoA ligase
VLTGYDKVTDACVLGIYDSDQATELPRAYMVKAALAKDIEDFVLEKEIQQWFNRKVSNHKRLRGGI